MKYGICRRIIINFNWNISTRTIIVNRRHFPRLDIFSFFFLFLFLLVFTLLSFCLSFFFFLSLVPLLWYSFFARIVLLFKNEHENCSSLCVSNHATLYISTEWRVCVHYNIALYPKCLYSIVNLSLSLPPCITRFLPLFFTSARSSMEEKRKMIYFRRPKFLTL